MPYIPPLEVLKQETNVNTEGVTPSPAMDAARAALRKAESTIKAQKMKKLSNKNKECTSIVGAIVKLIEQGQGSSSGMVATMNMMLMRQMERINKSMESWDRGEEKERKKEHKCWRKQQAKKRQRRPGSGRPLKASRTMEAKPGQDSSSSSSSSNSEDSESSSSDDEDGGWGGR
jgi:hypothetical protein